jgi:hypothetical protein
MSVASILVTLMTGLKFFSSAQPLRLHVVVALTSVTLALFAHTMTMFYFIGTSKKIKEFTAEWEPEVREGIRKKIIFIKRKLFPGMTFVCLALMAAFILGGAADAKAVSKDLHSWFAYGAFVYHVHVVVKETLYLFKNISLIDEVNDLARKRTSPAAAST